MKNILPWGLCMLLAFFLFLTIQTCKKHQRYSEQLTGNLAHANDSSRIWKDLFGREHAEKLLLQGSFPNIDAVKGDLLDSVSKALKTAKKNIESVGAASVVSKNVVTGRIDTIHDTIKYVSVSYSDRWIDLKCSVTNPPTIEYTTFDSLIISAYRKKAGWFKKEAYIDAYSINPHSSIKGVTGIKVYEEKSKRFGIGPYLGYGFNGQQWQPNIGISIQYSLIKF